MMTENRYRSRKFIVTLAGLALGTITAFAGVLTADLSNIILAAMASYNIANAWVSRNNDRE